MGGHDIKAKFITSSKYSINFGLDILWWFFCSCGHVMFLYLWMTTSPTLQLENTTEPLECLWMKFGYHSIIERHCFIAMPRQRGWKMWMYINSKERHKLLTIIFLWCVCITCQYYPKCGQKDKHFKRWMQNRFQDWKNVFKLEMWRRE